MQPQFSAQVVEQPLRTDTEGRAVMPEWSDGPDGKPEPPPAVKPRRKRPAKATPPVVEEPRKRQAKALQPNATHLDSVTQAQKWLDDHPEEAEMLRAAQAATGDILADSGVGTRWYSSTEAAAFFDKTVQWLYWGMRHPPHGGRLFVEPVLTADGTPVTEFDDEGREVPIMRDIPVVRLGDPKTGKRRFDIPTIRKFAKSAYLQANIKEPKLRAVLQRLIVAEHGGDWKSIPIPTRPGDDDGPA